MRTPPFLLGAVLVFWGWQAGFLVPGVGMALVIEAARVFPIRWEFSDEDFTRIWTLCLVILLAAAVYAFTANEGPSDLKGFFQSPSFMTQRGAGLATARTTSSVFRWLPMIFFWLAAAQAYSSRDAIPLHVISVILRHRLKIARKLGLPAPISRSFNACYVFFAVCLFSSSVHSADDASFFWGFCMLTGWALWPHRSPRFGFALWIGTLALVIGTSYFGQRGLNQFQGYLGNLNPQWLGAFSRHRFDPTQSQTEIGNLGRIKTSPRIVIRLEASNGAPPKRLREATYRGFKGRTWSADITENDFSRVAEPTNETTFRFVDKPTTGAVKIACYLPGGKGLLPLPEGVVRLEHLLAYNVWKSPLGAVLEQGPGLVVFDALYAPGSTLDAPPGHEREDLGVPDREEPALNQVVSELNLKGQDLDQALQTLMRFFSTQFTYSTWHAQDRSTRRNETQLTRFLLNSRSGHCEYFATAAVLLLRSIKIPARYSVGYAVHEGSGQQYVVRQRDAHAWCLVWDARRQAWRDFDPTPASWIAIDAQQVTTMQRVSDLWARVSFEISKFRWGQSHVRQYVLWTLVLVLALLVYQIVFRKRLRSRKEPPARQGHTWPGLDSEFYALERKLAAHGMGRQPSEPLASWLQRIAKQERLSEITPALRELLELHYRYRFDPLGLNSGDRERLRLKARACSVELEQTEALVG